MTPEERFERIDKTLIAIDARLDRVSKRGDRTDALLDRAVREARAERARERNANAEFDETMRKLAAAQVVTEEKLQGLIEALRRGGNGHV
jgi:hypothetical protein